MVAKEPKARKAAGLIATLVAKTKSPVALNVKPVVVRKAKKDQNIPLAVLPPAPVKSVVEASLGAKKQQRGKKDENLKI